MWFKKINQYWKNYNEKQQSPDHTTPSTPMRQILFESFLLEDISISLKKKGGGHVPMFLDLSILDIYWFPVMVDEDLPLLQGHLPSPLPPSTVKSPFSAKLITNVYTVTTTEMFTALPSSVLGKNFSSYTVFSFPAFHSFLKSLSLKYPVIFKGFIILLVPLSPLFPQSFFPEALPPGYPLGLLPSYQSGASSLYKG